MKILAISGSLRKDGNSEAYCNMVLEEAKAQGADVKLISLAGKKLSGCTGCYSCVQAKKCVVEDDFQVIFQEIITADGILLASPVYHSSITAELKAVLDRTGFSGRWAMNQMQNKGDSYVWKGTVMSDKVVAPITVARRAGRNFAFAQVLLWAAANDCIIVGNTYWNVGVAGKGGARDAADDTEGVGIMKGLAGRMVTVINAMKKAGAAT